MRAFAIAVCAALLVTACESARDPRAVALDLLHLRVLTTPRLRAAEEAPNANTNAYAALELAYGYARIGDAATARELVAQARTALPANDRVHDYLVAAYAARVEQAVAGQAMPSALPDALDAQLAALNRVSRYKVDRLRERSQVLEALERPDAIAAYAAGWRDVRGLAIEALRTLSPERRGDEIERLLSTVATAPSDRRRPLVAGCMDNMLALPAGRATALLATAVTAADALEPADRATVYAKALVVAARVTPQHANVVAQRLGDALADASDDDAAAALLDATRALRQVNATTLLATLAAKVGIRANLPDVAALAAATAAGNGTSAARTLDGVRAELRDRSLVPAVRLPAIAALGRAYATLPRELALPALDDLTDELVHTTDHFGTNSHYCVSVLALVDALVIGIVGD